MYYFLNCFFICQILLLIKTDLNSILNSHNQNKKIIIDPSDLVIKGIYESQENLITLNMAKLERNLTMFEIKIKASQIFNIDHKEIILKGLFQY